MTLRAGAAQAVITPPLGPMAGYIRRDGPAEAVLDDLRARVLVLDDGATRLAIVALDLLYATAALNHRVRAQAGCEVLVAATHTHCGPARLARDTELLDAIAERTAGALARATAALRPARLLLGSAAVPGLARNRRDPATASDDTVRVLAVVDEDRATIATVLEFACHPTILEHDTRAYSPEFPGAACATAEAVAGGVGLFLQGCAADVNPAYLEHTQCESRRAGAIIGAAAGRVAAELPALLGEPKTINLSWEEELAAPPLIDGRVVTGALGAASAAVPAAPRPAPDAAAVAADLADLRLHGDPRRDGPRIAELWALDLLAGGPELEWDLDPAGATLAVQGLRLGNDLVLLGLPGEIFTATGAAVRDSTQADLLIASCANQSVGYLPPAAEIPRRGYEVGRARYADGTAERVARAASDIVNELTTPAEGPR